MKNDAFYTSWCLNLTAMQHTYILGLLLSLILHIHAMHLKKVFFTVKLYIRKLKLVTAAPSDMSSFAWYTFDCVH